MGRKRKYTPEQLEKRIREYFKYAEKEKKPPTFAGLAIYLDIHRSVLYDYETLPDYSDIIKKAREMILADKIERLITGKGSTPGVIFYLKNVFGWTDKQEVTQTINAHIEARKKLDLSELSTEDLKRLNAAIEQLHGNVIDITPENDALRGP